jgi:hypothetical protein
MKKAILVLTVFIFILTLQNTLAASPVPFTEYFDNFERLTINSGGFFYDGFFPGASIVVDSITGSRVLNLKNTSSSPVNFLIADLPTPLTNQWVMQYDVRTLVSAGSTSHLFVIQFLADSGAYISLGIDRSVSATSGYLKVNFVTDTISNLFTSSQVYSVMAWHTLALRYNYPKLEIFVDYVKIGEVNAPQLNIRFTKVGINSVHICSGSICDEYNVDNVFVAPSGSAFITKVSLDNVPLNSTTPFTFFPHDYDVQQNTVRRISITFQNTGPELTTFLVGLTIGEHVIAGITTGPPATFCNQDCYDKNVSFFRALTGDYWVARVTLPPQDSATVVMPFNFRGDIFQVGKSYGTSVAIWLERNQSTIRFIDMLHSININETQHRIKIISSIPPPQGSNLTIIRIEPSDSQPTFDQRIKVKVHVRNTGMVTLDRVFVGLSLIQGSSVCNRDCYTDGLGDYFILGTIYPQDELIAEREFKIRSDKFTTGPATFIATAHTQPYVGPEFTLANATQGITIIPPSQKLNACPIHLKASHMQARIGDTVSYTATIENRGRTHTFYLGMSIGKWDSASPDFEYTSPQPANLQPCNVDCYKDNLGNFVKKTIPTNFTDFFTRKFEIPDYFPQGPFDVAVGVWASTKIDENTGEEIGDYPICFVYFKNVTTIIEGESGTREMGNFLSSILTGGATVMSMAAGTDLESGKALFVLILISIGNIIVAYLTRSAKFTSLTFVISLIAGAFVAPVLWLLALIAIIIVGYMFAKQFSGD